MPKNDPFAPRVPDLVALKKHLETCEKHKLTSMTIDTPMARRLVDDIDALIAAAKSYALTNPAFRSRPIGGENSPARLDQKDKIEAEDTLTAAIARIEGR